MMEQPIAHMILPRQDGGMSGTDTLVELLSKGFGSEVRRHGTAVQKLSYFETDECHRSPMTPSTLHWEPHLA